MSKPISYRGIVTNVYPGILQVEIRDETACDACSAQGSCVMSGAREKRIEVPFASGDYCAGDAVTVVGKSSAGLRATFFAFLLPLILLFVILIIATALGLGDHTAALLSLAALAIYYAGLFLFRKRLKQTFTFTIQNNS
jgi:positive regulator of sigma E activity